MDKVTELKARVFDILVGIENLQLQLRQTNQQITEELNKPKEVKE